LNTEPEELMTALKSFHLNKVNEQPLTGPPKVGDVVAAKFTADNDWYRAQVRRVDREAKKADVTYLDYGNSETESISGGRCALPSAISHNSTLSGGRGQLH
jgi:hypothetical protein